MNISGQDPAPRFMLVEDDPISQGFFQATLESLPARVDTAGSLADAVQLAGTTHHDLWLIDVNLPDGSGTDLLRRLRHSHPGIPALAHTADGGVAAHGELLAAGFSETLVKPLTPESLLKAVRRTLARGGDAGSLASENRVTDWDETAALAALNGQRGHLLALRELFLAELPGTRDAVVSALQQHDETALRGQLHRLQASCGFVGATRLGRAVRQLHRDPASPQAQSQFSDAVAALLH